MEILGIEWFNTCGIVKVRTAHEGIKYYIRALIPGNSEAEDIQLICNYGSTFPDHAGDVLFGD